MGARGGQETLVVSPNLVGRELHMGLLDGGMEWRVGSILASPPQGLFLMDISRTGGVK